jgi:hypothetical protein
MKSPYSSYPSAHGDVLSSLTDSAMAVDAVEQARRQSDLAKQSKEFSNRYSLQGMQNDMEIQRQRDSLTQTRMDGMFGGIGSLLRGLY